MWPNDSGLALNDIDRASDDPDLGRAQLVALYDKIVLMIAERGTVGGICDLDAGVLVPTSRIPAGAYTEINVSKIFTGRVSAAGSTITGGPAGWTVGSVVVGALTWIVVKHNLNTENYQLMLSSAVISSGNATISSRLIEASTSFTYVQYKPDGTSGLLADTTFMLITT